ncbi:MAG TPA: DUF1648 domain-containing protein [Crocinitomix sp.]|nr:DUF1648 domain-containing protein [Crocinitomix sp.]
MKFELKKELPLMFIVALPFMYMYFIWNELADKVPLHWNYKGEVDRYGSKYELILIPFLLPFLIYVLFLIIPLIDPKGKIEKMGKKFYSLKFILTTGMSILAIYIIYSSKVEKIANPNMIILGVGALYLILGNYFKTIKPNYFIGIKTPWTLENETVWNETHKLSGKMWFVGGLLVIILALILNQKLLYQVFIGITIFITLVPIVYSYIRYKKYKTQ